MNLKTSISKIFEIFFFLSLTHTVHLHACEMEREQRRRFFIIFGLKKLPEYKMRSNKRQGHKSGDYLSYFLSKLKFSWDPCRRKKSKTVIFLLSSVASSRCAANWQTRIWKLKFKSNKLVDFRKLYMNMVVFGLELLNFWSWFRIWTWKHRFQKFLTNFIFSLLKPHHAFACIWDGEGAEETFFHHFWPQKATRI